MKHVYLTAALVEVFCFGALLGGWSNIGKLIRGELCVALMFNSTLSPHLDAGHFARECNNATASLNATVGDCKSQANSIARIYSISIRGAN